MKIHQSKAETIRDADPRRNPYAGGPYLCLDIDYGVGVVELGGSNVLFAERLTPDAARELADELRDLAAEADSAADLAEEAA